MEIKTEVYKNITESKLWRRLIISYPKNIRNLFDSMSEILDFYRFIIKNFVVQKYLTKAVLTLLIIFTITDIILIHLLNKFIYSFLQQEYYKDFLWY